MAYSAARQCLPDHSSRFSRRDFTLAQLFACLVVPREAELSHKPVPARIDAYAIAERRRALEWLPGSEAWDAVQLNT